MRDHSKHIQVDKEEAVQIIIEHCLFHPEKESIPIEQAAGLVNLWQKDKPAVG